MTGAGALEDPARGTYLRWILFGPSVIEPCAYGKQSSWEYRPDSAGWGTWEEMHDLCFGATVRYLLQFGMLEKRGRITAYAERLAARPAHQRGAAANGAVIQERGLA